MSGADGAQGLVLRHWLVANWRAQCAIRRVEETYKSKVGELLELLDEFRAAALATTRDQMAEKEREVAALQNAYERECVSWARDLDATTKKSKSTVDSVKESTRYEDADASDYATDTSTRKNSVPPSVEPARSEEGEEGEEEGEEGEEEEEEEGEEEEEDEGEGEDAGTDADEEEEVGEEKSECIDEGEEDGGEKYEGEEDEEEEDEGDEVEDDDEDDEDEAQDEAQAEEEAQAEAQAEDDEDEDEDEDGDVIGTSTQKNSFASFMAPSKSETLQSNDINSASTRKKSVASSMARSRSSTQSDDITSASTQKKNVASSMARSKSKTRQSDDMTSASTQKESVASSMARSRSKTQSDDTTDASTQKESAASSIARTRSNTQGSDGKTSASTQKKSVASSMTPSKSETPQSGDINSASTQKKSVASSVVPSSSSTQQSDDISGASTQKESIASSMTRSKNETLQSDDITSASTRKKSIASSVPRSRTEPYQGGDVSGASRRKKSGAPLMVPLKRSKPKRGDDVTNASTQKQTTALSVEPSSKAEIADTEHSLRQQLVNTDENPEMTMNIHLWKTEQSCADVQQVNSEFQFFGKANLSAEVAALLRDKKPCDALASRLPLSPAPSDAHDKTRHQVSPTRAASSNIACYCDSAPGPCAPLVPAPKRANARRKASALRNAPAPDAPSHLSPPAVPNNGTTPVWSDSGVVLKYPHRPIKLPRDDMEVYNSELASAVNVATGDQLKSVPPSKFEKPMAGNMPSAGPTAFSPLAPSAVSATHQVGAPHAGAPLHTSALYADRQAPGKSNGTTNVARASPFGNVPSKISTYVRATDASPPKTSGARPALPPAYTLSAASASHGHSPVMNPTVSRLDNTGVHNAPYNAFDTETSEQPRSHLRQTTHVTRQNFATEARSAVGDVRATKSSHTVALGSVFDVDTRDRIRGKECVTSPPPLSVSTAASLNYPTGTTERAFRASGITHTQGGSMYDTVFGYPFNAQGQGTAAPSDDVGARGTASNPPATTDASRTVVTSGEDVTTIVNHASTQQAMTMLGLSSVGSSHPPCETQPTDSQPTTFQAGSRSVMESAACGVAAEAMTQLALAKPEPVRLSVPPRPMLRFAGSTPSEYVFANVSHGDNETWRGKPALCPRPDGPTYAEYDASRKQPIASAENDTERQKLQRTVSFSPPTEFRCDAENYQATLSSACETAQQQWESGRLVSAVGLHEVMNQHEAPSSTSEWMPQVPTAVPTSSPRCSHADGTQEQSVPCNGHEIVQQSAAPSTAHPQVPEVFSVVHVETPQLGSVTTPPTRSTPKDTIVRGFTDTVTKSSSVVNPSKEPNFMAVQPAVASSAPSLSLQKQPCLSPVIEKHEFSVCNSTFSEASRNMALAPARLSNYNCISKMNSTGPPVATRSERLMALQNVSTQNSRLRCLTDPLRSASIEYSSESPKGKTRLISPVHSKRAPLLALQPGESTWHQDNLNRVRDSCLTAVPSVQATVSRTPPFMSHDNTTHPLFGQRPSERSLSPPGNATEEAAGERPVKRPHECLKPHRPVPRGHPAHVEPPSQLTHVVEPATLLKGRGDFEAELQWQCLTRPRSHASALDGDLAADQNANTSGASAELSAQQRAHGLSQIDRIPATPSERHAQPCLIDAGLLQDTGTNPDTAAWLTTSVNAVERTQHKCSLAPHSRPNTFTWHADERSSSPFAGASAATRPPYPNRVN